MHSCLLPSSSIHTLLPTPLLLPIPPLLLLLLPTVRACTFINMCCETDVGLDRWLCVTLILAAEATVKLPKIRSLQDLREALSMLGGLPPDALVAVELLWTPQESGDAYSKDEMLVDYPRLATL